MFFNIRGYFEISVFEILRVDCINIYNAEYIKIQVSFIDYLMYPKYLDVSCVTVMELFIHCI